MFCPHCSGIRLVISERQGIEIDYCPQCRGVWLDRGELDKLIEKSVSTMQNMQPAAPAYNPPPQAYQPPPQSYQHPPQQGYYKQKRPKSFWEEIFD